MAFDEGMVYSMPLEVYFQSAVVRGILCTNQDRLSNYFILREGDEVFYLREASLEGLNRNPVALSSDEYLLYMQEVFLIADLSPQLRSERSGLEPLYVKKEASKALLGVGPFWLRGNIHLIPGGVLHDLLVARTRFIPVTDATLVDRPDIGPRTYLVNRTKIGFITAVAEGLEEL
jgi:Family of unknown function (DUF6812)